MLLSFYRYEEIYFFQFNGDSGIFRKIRVFLNKTQIYDHAASSLPLRYTADRLSGAQQGIQQRSGDRKL